jgi:hypothetical protein
MKCGLAQLSIYRVIKEVSEIRRCFDTCDHNIILVQNAFTEVSNRLELIEYTEER